MDCKGGVAEYILFFPILSHMELEQIKRRVVPILKKYKVRKAGIFGSYVKGNKKDFSDIDIVVELGEKVSLLDFVEIKLALEDALNMSVDLVEYKGLKPALKERILTEQVPIL